MTKSILNFLNKYSYNTKDVNRLLVSAFLQTNSIGEVVNQQLGGYIIVEEGREEFEELQKFVALLSQQQTILSIEDLIQLFEFVVSPADKEVNGAVYTPQYIRNYIVNTTLDRHLKSKAKKIEDIVFADIACGCGGFFVTITLLLKKRFNLSFQQIYEHNIYGLDIEHYSIERTKILLILLAINHEEDLEHFSFNLKEGNALSFDWNDIPAIKKNEGFDIIVGNPPYITASNIDATSKVLLKSWEVSKKGKADLYIPFFEIGLKYLNEQGVLGFLTVNTFYKSINGRGIRSYFTANKSNLTIIDFGGEQLFQGRSTYTCICIISKDISETVKYVKTSSQSLIQLGLDAFIEKKYKDLNDFDGWRLIPNDISNNISNIETVGRSLDDKFLIRNGFATLKNRIFIFKPVKETKLYFYLDDGGDLIKIEKGICRDTIKPNTLKSDDSVDANLEKVIFPYEYEVFGEDLFDEKRKNLKVISEDEFITKYPCAYNYLVSKKDILKNRDKGKKKYPAWYAFGRSQALNIEGYKLLFPYIAKSPCFVLSDNKDLLFYNGYAILSQDLDELKVLQKILMSKIFWYYIEHTSKPYSGGYWALAKNYVKKFGVCDLTKSEKIKILKYKKQDSVDAFLMKKYNISLI